MKVLVACEYSGTVRDAFIRRGHDAWSCDFEESESDFGPHHVGDVQKFFTTQSWDLMIAHPPCTYLANSGARWLYNVDKSWNYDRWHDMFEAAEFFQWFLDADCPRIAVENPIPHGWTGFRKPDCRLQPWQYGHLEKKQTCLWLKNLPPLVPTNILDKTQAKAAVHEMGPSKDRWKDRSRTYTGFAEAMALQWG